VDQVTKPIEADLLYPLLRAKDVLKWSARYSAHILVPHTAQTGWRSIEEEALQKKYPKAYAYLGYFRKLLLARVAYNLLRKGHPFYTVMDISADTFAPWKVVWPNIASDLQAAVVGPVGLERKPAVPQHIVTMVPFDNETEANYLCSLINTSSANFAARTYSQEGGKSFGDPHVLDHIRIPKFDPKDKVHKRLAELSMQAHEAAKKCDEKAVAEIEAQVDLESAKLWNLSASDLAQIQRSLKELTE
jgi:hypothetical protein